MGDKNIFKKLLTVKQLIFFLIFLTFLILFVNKVQAQFSVTPEIPENNLEKIQSFLLRLSPSTKQQLHFKVTNLENQEIKLKVKVANAVTTDSGQSNASNSINKEVDPSLPYHLDQLISFNPEIIIPSQATVDYTAELTTPSKKYDGYIIGGFNFLEEASDDNNNNSSKATTKNAISTEIGIVLIGRSTKVKREMKLNNVFFGTHDDQSVIKGNLQNSTMARISKIETAVKIYQRSDSKHKKPILQKSASNLEMEPNSNFNFAVPIGKTSKFKSGKYTWVQTVTSANGDWKFKRDFVIKKSELPLKEQKAESTARSKTIVKSPVKTSPWIIVLVIFVLILIVVVVVVIVKLNWGTKRVDD